MVLFMRFQFLLFTVCNGFMLKYLIFLNLCLIQLTTQSLLFFPLQPRLFLRLCFCERPSVTKLVSRPSLRHKVVGVTNDHLSSADYQINRSNVFVLNSVIFLEARNLKPLIFENASNFRTPQESSKMFSFRFWAFEHSAARCVVFTLPKFQPNHHRD